MPEVGSWKQRVSGIFCHILILTAIIKFIFQTWNALKEISLQENSSFHVNVGVLRDTSFCYMCQHIYLNPEIKFTKLEKKKSIVDRWSTFYSKLSSFRLLL